MRRPAVAAAALVLALFAAACGGGGRSGTPAASRAATTGPPDAGASTTSATSATTPTAVDAGAAADRAKAEGLLLQAADVPPGWTSRPHQKDPTQDESNRRLAACVGRPDPLTYETADVYGPDLSDGSTQQVASNAALVRTDADARADVAAFATDKMLSCTRDEVTSLLQSQQQGSSFSVRSVETARLEAPPHGDTTFGIRATVTVDSDKGPVALYFDLVLYVKGRAEASATLVGAGRPFDPALERDLLSKLGARVDALGI